MIDLQLENVNKLATKLFNTFNAEGQIYPPADFCATDESCFIFVLDRHRITNKRIEKILSRIILDAQKPTMTIEDLFFVRERLSFAMFLSGVINPCREGQSDIVTYSDDVRINIKGTSTEHFLMWLVDSVFYGLGEESLFCIARQMASQSRELKLSNSQWLLMRQDPHLYSSTL